MSGLLDNKVRILDTIVTSLGRQQLSYGGLNIKYVSFSDSATFYKKDIVSGTQDSTQRAYFEASDLLQDQITLTADDSGKLLPFQNTNDVNIKAGQFIQYSYMPITSSILTGSSDTAFTLQGDDFATLSETLLQSSIDNFTNLQLIGTFDKLFDDDGFDIGSKQLEFIISNNSPIVDNNKFIANVTNIDSIFSDVRFSQIDNFKFLPKGTLKKSTFVFAKPNHVCFIISSISSITKGNSFKVFSIFSILKISREFFNL